MTGSFDLPPDTAVLVCTTVFNGGTILHVSRDEEGDWQFLCDEDHSVEGACPPKVVGLGEVVKWDPAVLDLSDLRPGGSASRSGADEPWSRQDGSEAVIREHVREHGWHACMIEEDDQGAGFLYSIGVFETWKQPEIILFGLPPPLAHALVTAAVDRIRDGGTLPLGSPVAGILETGSVVFQEVHPSQYREYFGYALWYYDGPKFPALQCVLPDQAGSASMQPDLSRPA